MLAFILFLACPVAHAADEAAKFTNIKQGEVAPFDGRLFNDAAVSKFIVENRMKIEQCNIQIEYEVSKANAASKYQYDLLYVKCEASDQRLNEVLSIRDEEIKFLRKSYKPFPRYCRRKLAEKTIRKKHYFGGNLSGP